jgi:pimeloyl-ACP methyl ester carboxylesterase
VAEGIEDNELAAQFLAGKGFKNPIVIGHSNGGVLASEHVARHPETRALVLLSAHAGGNRLTDPNSASRYTINEKTDDLIKEAQELLATGKPRQLMLLPTWWHVISAKTFMDRLTNVPNLVENAARIRCPVLFIRGDQSRWTITRPKGSRKTVRVRAMSPSSQIAITFTSARKNAW